MAVLTGWALHNLKLVGVPPDLMGAVVNTAIGLVLAGLLLDPSATAPYAYRGLLSIPDPEEPAGP